MGKLYENSGVVSFYGTYEYPTEESTTATSNSSTTTEPTKPDGGASSVLSSGVYESRQGRLPTGTTNQAPFIYLGISLITIGILFIKRRREDENSISSSRIVGFSGVLATQQAFAEDINVNYTSNGAITFEPDTDPTKPVNPTNPDEKLNQKIQLTQLDQNQDCRPLIN